MLEVISQPFVAAARAKGLSERTVVWRHAFRNALLPLVTLVGLSIPGMVGGSIIVETIFAWPGMGALALDAVLARDYNMLMASLLVSAVLVLLSNLATDVAYVFVDPRIRLE